MTTRAQLRRYGNNLNQAARILNAGGDPPEWLKNAIALTDRVVQRIDERRPEPARPAPPAHMTFSRPACRSGTATMYSSRAITFTSAAGPYESAPRTTPALLR